MSDNDLIFVAGDFNGPVGQQPGIFHGVLGGHGVGTRNEEVPENNKKKRSKNERHPENHKLIKCKKQHKSLKRLLTNAKLYKMTIKPTVKKHGRPNSGTCPNLLEGSDFLYKQGQRITIKTGFTCASENLIYNIELARTLENKNCLIINGNIDNYQAINNTNATNNHVYDNTNNTVNTSEEIHNENPNNNSINNNNNSNDHLNGSDDNTQNSYYETDYNTSNPLNINLNQLNEHNNTSTVNIVDEINLPSSNYINCISSNTTNNIDIINYDNYV
ncbi:myb-like protein D [Octopus bimaculoides]|uniref:myb-like protein D n=1 Tax=Octopus bimaculoides TaxID=37653 RepID=UPI00071C90A8|nr:myb-like protein D [Octopus bimaculoides]|eukprot:XP_014789184.1 PREDICTED: myb-like protein D [Octopus bimaculoides]